MAARKDRKARRTTTWLDLTCPLCGQKIDLADGLIADHASKSNESCAGSGRHAMIPDYVISAPYECGKCGRTTRSNLGNGLVYSHNLPNSTEVCPNSSKGLGPLGVRIEAELLPPKIAQRDRVSKKSGQVRGYAESTSQSVRTVSGGLPSHGRRR